eukprot:TRINITY_DN1997_c0_g2_i1.p1 TRINITY_DN1997_c0_g2~~TRINITY_DN1997_c0_g2_i1.p1  ORF type:complete len:660 (+),score=132.64 TRINITY_DN1997_c0_g2_i1:28-1980(+)
MPLDDEQITNLNTLFTQLQSLFTSAKQNNQVIASVDQLLDQIGFLCVAIGEAMDSDGFIDMTRKEKSVFDGLKKKLNDMFDYLPLVEGDEELEELENDLYYVAAEWSIIVKPNPRSAEQRKDTMERLEKFGRRASLHFSQRASIHQDFNSEKINIEALMVPLINDETSAFVVDSPGEDIAPAVLRVTSDIYEDEYFSDSHYNYCGLNKKDQCETVVSILKTPSMILPESTEFLNFGTAYKGLITHKNGTTEFSINSLALANYTTKPSIGKKIEEFLNDRAKGLHYYQVRDKKVSNAILDIEKRHPQRVKEFKVAILYALPGQTAMTEIFANQPPDDSLYWTFLEQMGQRIRLDGWNHYRGDLGVGEGTYAESYYTKWNELEIMYHIAPWHSPEQHRRLIGNDICFIIFYESPDNAPFNPQAIVDLGTVPQVFSVVQPFRNLYRLGFFNRTNLKTYGPPAPPSDYLFDGSNLKDYLLTKLHNGMRMTMDCPPMNRLFTTPRAATIKDLAEKFPRGMKVTRPQDSPIATRISVTILSARDLVAVNKDGTSDPYVTVRVGSERKKTPHCRKSLNPVWNHKMEFDLTQEDIEIGEFKFVVSDWEKSKNKHSYMGEFLVVVSEALDSLGHELEFELYGTTVEIVSGSVTVQFDTA